jgi:hypothetical protein
LPKGSDGAPVFYLSNRGNVNEEWMFFGVVRKGEKSDSVIKVSAMYKELTRNYHLSVSNGEKEKIELLTGYKGRFEA